MDDPTPAIQTPGQLLRALLEERGWTGRTLAIVLGVDETSVNKMLADKRSFDIDLSLKLDDIFGVPAERFLDLQQAFSLAKARLTARPDPSRASRAQLFGGLPLTEMMNRGWIGLSDTKDVRAIEGELARFFGAASGDDIEILPHAAKKTHVSEGTTPAQLAWLHRVKQIASEMIVPRYSPKAVQTAVQKLSNLLGAPEDVRTVPRIMAECGVRFVIVETLKAAKIDGVCFWLNDESPVIGMTLRHDRIDNFWFVLRHECEHVLRLHGRQSPVMIDAELEGDRAGTGEALPAEERQANQAAADFCVPPEQMKAFMDRKAPFFAERDLLGFARTLRIHPGLVAGQLQHRTGRFDRFRNHLVKVRSIIAPSAMVDGWGDVIPVG